MLDIKKIIAVDNEERKAEKCAAYAGEARVPDRE